MPIETLPAAQAFHEALIRTADRARRIAERLTALEKGDAWPSDTHFGRSSDLTQAHVQWATEIDWELQQVVDLMADDLPD